MQVDLLLEPFCTKAPAGQHCKYCINIRGTTLKTVLPAKL